MKRKYKKITNTQRMKSLNEKITSNDLVFKIKDFIKKIDLTELEKALSGTGRGQHPIPLWVPLVIWFYAFTQGEQRYRKIGELCQKNDDYYWLSCGFEPSDAYFHHWKKIVMPLMENLSSSYKNYLLNNGLLETETIGIDGVKVKTWASLSQSKTGNPGKGGWQFKDGFVYDEEMDVVLCPEKMVLSRKADMIIKGKYIRQVFRSCQGICGPCDKKKVCLGKSGTLQKAGDNE